MDGKGAAQNSGHVRGIHTRTPSMHSLYTSAHLTGRPMSKNSTLCWSTDSTLLATAEGSEVLVYDANSDAGLWRHDLEESVSLVRFAAKNLLVMTSKGTLLCFDRKNGKQLFRTALGKGEP